MDTTDTVIETVIPGPKIPAICEHIKDNGLRCGSPALRGRHFCYFHSRAHLPTGRFGHRNYRAAVPETTESLMIAAAHVMQALATGDAPPKLANSMLYGLNLSKNLLRMKSYYPDKDRASMATEIPPAMQEVLAAPEEQVSEPVSQIVLPPDPHVRRKLSDDEVERLAADLLTDQEYHDITPIMNAPTCNPGVDHPEYDDAKRRLDTHWEAVYELRGNGVELSDSRVQAHLERRRRP